jgi:hypothetical protein
VTLTDAAMPDRTCVCDPLCAPVADGCAKTVARADCDCCQVCAVGNAGEKCHDVTAPCDEALGLECDDDLKICKGKQTPGVQVRGSGNEK